jgi:hypothetical protein
MCTIMNSMWCFHILFIGTDLGVYLLQKDLPGIIS